MPGARDDAGDPRNNRRNRNHALALAGVMAVMASAFVGWFFPPVLLSLGLCPSMYWLVRRRCLRRLRIMGQSFPASWEQVLQTHVAFFRALPDHEKERFRQLVKVFLSSRKLSADPQSASPRGCGRQTIRFTGCFLECLNRRFAMPQKPFFRKHDNWWVARRRQGNKRWQHKLCKGSPPSCSTESTPPARRPRAAQPPGRSRPGAAVAGPVLTLLFGGRQHPHRGRRHGHASRADRLGLAPDPHRTRPSDEGVGHADKVFDAALVPQRTPKCSSPKLRGHVNRVSRPLPADNR